MNIILKIKLIFLFSINLEARERGETEITSEDGIEVYQNEKFYLLKKNVKIESDEFVLNADNVKITFDKSLYDITELIATGDVNFNSNQFKMNGSKTLNFKVKIENLKVEGADSELMSDNVEMFSDGYIEINNINGNFVLNGSNSKLVNENIIIEAESINGVFSNNENQREVYH